MFALAGYALGGSQETEKVFHRWFAHVQRVNECAVATGPQRGHGGSPVGQVALKATKVYRQQLVEEVGIPVPRQRGPDGVGCQGDVAASRVQLFGHAAQPGSVEQVVANRIVAHDEHPLSPRLVLLGQGRFIDPVEALHLPGLAQLVAVLTEAGQ